MGRTAKAKEQELDTKNVEVKTKPESNVEDVKQYTKQIDKRDLSEFILVKNATRGKLFYISKRQMGYEVVWEKYMDPQWIELSELQNMKSSQTAFFKNNWIEIPDKTVLEYLNVAHFYKDSIDLENFDDVFNLGIEEFTEKIRNAPLGLQHTIAGRARELITSGDLDSNNKIKILEKELNIDLSM